MQVCVYLLLVLHITEGCSLAENQKTDDVTAYTGDSVLLPCSCTDPHAKPESFTWRKHNTNRNSWDVITSESEQYRNRVQLGTAHSPGNLSLLISHLTEEDKGYYRCYLNQYYKDIRLTIKGCSLAENQKTDDITAYTGDSVLLPCSCTEPHAKPENITWQKYNTRRQTWDVITSESEQYRNRDQLGTAHSPGNLSLLISHLTEEDKGDYRCYLTNQKYKDIRLTIKGISTTEFTSRFDVKTSAKAPADASTTDSAKTLTDDVQNPAGDRLYILMTTAVGAVLLLLLGLVGVLCWRYKVQRHGQTRLRKGQTEEKREQETQDDVTYSTLVYSQKTKPASTPMDNADYTEYASIKLNSN
ncbi:CD276 antigen homolog isoform X2 [Electrophorus electricus]|uniref:CD276 antigen homolog isoform X2 n=1 Tax=Electrophorus electricus TaxID=8005 RepID=UPI0015D01F21|nr:CD276 antigen homolog isoform X2 [Electrophorus electricus]